ncbi:type VII secretion integral membrane protein EccD [Micromonospora aurantiaca (nom. illeg.)]|uniref:type VII secretion integral membrane protein EccD n=1 Tax=Micromonospora aurantiaca (nom. illeg.) TaxID=47850 RepID=UPI001656CD88|nr:type VII secretion integral membrane protein EccD [Micromonospora aurantiaca]MBC9005702.1 type VII secretion integral membrane protein EccD [Micromonospora aurantiaca]
MTAALNDQLCRITVIGPARRADLAVPARMPVANLMPLLVRHTTDVARVPDGEVPDESWVLQRLGQPPFELSGTPESLDWLEGEELHLRPAQDPLPELDFDDLAEGVATVVNRRADRWQPEYRRVLFLVLSLVAMGLIAAVLVDRGPVLPQVIAGAVLAAGLFTAAIVSARQQTDGAFPLLFGGGAAFFAAVAASSAVDGDPDGVAWTAAAGLAAAVAVVAVTAFLLIAQRTVTPVMPFAPLLIVALTAAMVVLVLLAGDGFALTAPQVSAVAVSVILVLIVIAPRAAVKLARLRGPQLPKTGADMSYDIEPEDSDMVKSRADEADTYLTACMTASALVLPVLMHHTMRVPGWSGWTLVLVTSSAILLRSRTFFGFWQRVALVAAGTVGYLMVALMFSDKLAPTGRYVLLGGLVALLVPLVMAALRPWPRRMLPFWEYTAGGLDVATGLVVLPVLAQVLGLYAWARGLFG